MENKIQKTQNLIVELNQAKKDIVKNYLIIGKILNTVNEENLWMSYADHLERFDDFLIEMKMGRSTSYNLMAIWRMFGEIIMSKNLDLEYFTLVKLLPVAKNNPKEWLHKAQHLIPKDLDIEIREAKQLPIPENCKHVRTIKLIKCIDCGKIWIDRSR